MSVDNNHNQWFKADPQCNSTNFHLKFNNNSLLKDWRHKTLSKEGLPLLLKLPTLSSPHPKQKSLRFRLLTLNNKSSKVFLNNKSLPLQPMLLKPQQLQWPPPKSLQLLPKKKTGGTATKTLKLIKLKWKPENCCQLLLSLPLVFPLPPSNKHQLLKFQPNKLNLLDSPCSTLKLNHNSSSKDNSNQPLLLLNNNQFNSFNNNPSSFKYFFYLLIVISHYILQIILFSISLTFHIINFIGINSTLICWLTTIWNSIIIKRYFSYSFFLFQLLSIKIY